MPFPNPNDPTTNDPLYCSPVNNTGIDPLQGFDFEVWSQDVCTGKIAWFGKFQSLTLSVRDATETYLELGQRVPTYLNGEIQVAWVLEQGLVDMAFIYRTFGVKAIRRDQFITRGPRFQISFDANAYEIDADAVANAPFGSLNRSSQDAYLRGSEEYSIFSPESYYGSQVPTAKGRYDLMRCKVDSVSLGIMPGRRVAAVRWEGVAEGITYVPQTVQQFKQRKGPNGPAGYGNFLGNQGSVNVPVEGNVPGLSRASAVNQSPSAITLR
jgi:hypothetical protein